MQRLNYSDPDFGARLDALCNRPGYPPEIEAKVAKIIDAVKNEGDAALVRFAREFDHAELTPAGFRVTAAELAAASKQLAAADRRAIDTALAQVIDFSRRRLPRSWSCSPRPGVKLGEKFTPLDRVGVYIPGGTAPLVSTVLHTAGVARAAGVKEIVAVTPPRRDGSVHPAVLYAMKRAGVSEIYRLGGVYGIAALAFGTDTVRPVEKIVGPGNAYVTAAKKLVYGKVAIDMIAGPSEILIVADETSDCEFVAADVLSQAEHGSGLEQAVVVSDSKAVLDAVEGAVARRKAELSRLAAVDKVLEHGTFLIQVPDLNAAADVAGRYAPEHLELLCARPERLVPKIKAAGAIFLGPWTPEPVGDFCAGPSHVLPTGGSARYFSGLTADGFFRRTSVVKYSAPAIRREIEVVERIAAMEGLSAHGLSGTVRRKPEK